VEELFAEPPWLEEGEVLLPFIDDDPVVPVPLPVP